MSVEQNKETFRRWIEEGWNRGDLSVVDQLYAPAYVSHSFPPGFAPDREGLKQFVTAFRTAFPDLHFTLDDVVGEGEKVIARFTGTGTHREAFMGIAATGKPIRVGGFLQARFEGGKWAEDWVSWDQLGMLQQLGVVPAAGQGTA
jgi:steroid delta-isomerase-like uncharacterized protein